MRDWILVGHELDGHTEEWVVGWDAQQAGRQADRRHRLKKWRKVTAVNSMQCHFGEEDITGARDNDALW